LPTRMRVKEDSMGGSGKMETAGGSMKETEEEEEARARGDDNVAILGELLLIVVDN